MGTARASFQTGRKEMRKIGVRIQDGDMMKQEYTRNERGGGGGY